jgi:membrane protein YqaA with SNARE-associated domain
LKTIRRLLEQYLHFIYSALRQPGIIPFAAIFSVGFIDAVIPLPGGMDALMATAILATSGNIAAVSGYVIAAAAGNALGNIIIYFIGRAGGEVFLEKRLGRQKFASMRARFEKREVLTLAIAAMLPPPFPFKTVALSAAVFDVNLPRYVFGIFVGRLLRFTILSVLVLTFGPQVIGIFTRLLRQHLALTLAGAAAVVIAILLGVILTRRVKAARIQPEK